MPHLNAEHICKCLSPACAVAKVLSWSEEAVILTEENLPVTDMGLS